MLNFHRNNLDKATSPYLQQHKDNPIHWQEWSKETVEYAKSNNKILFVSVGYATCHWCHVMAREAFSDTEVALFLNEHFVSIKVDREERPDIDQYMMSFLVQMQGSGGWPLNVFLTADMKPLYAATYIPMTAQYRTPTFLEVGKIVRNISEHQQEELVPYSPPIPQFEESPPEQIINSLYTFFDTEFGGFGTSTKFPHHCTLLFLLHLSIRDEKVALMIKQTLDTMATHGLHDHLGGGFFRYCVDSEWTIPHFEKMLYDQAMMLWVYSLAYRVFGIPLYKNVALGIIRCLEETFLDKSGLYWSAHDADTEHEEGKTYVWTKEELVTILGEKDFEKLAKVYSLERNFESGIHLHKRIATPLPAIEKKLLLIRNKRMQPFTDKKLVTSWNALVGIGFLMAYRYAGYEEGLLKAKSILSQIQKLHFQNKKLFHSSLGGVVSPHEFLEDSAAVLVLVSYLEEEVGGYQSVLKEFLGKVNSFSTTHWIESHNPDFVEMPASMFDHPTPSSVSLAALGIARASHLLGNHPPKRSYAPPLESDFYNISSLLSEGKFHLLHSPTLLDWRKIPPNSLQLREPEIQDCFLGACRQYKSVSDLLNAISSKN